MANNEIQNAPIIKGLNLIGTYELESGVEVPLYEIGGNETKESWNRSAKALFLKYYREKYGEDPKNEEVAFDAYSDALRALLGSEIALAAAREADLYAERGAVDE